MCHTEALSLDFYKVVAFIFEFMFSLFLDLYFFPIYWNADEILFIPLRVLGE